MHFLFLKQVELLQARTDWVTDGAHFALSAEHFVDNDPISTTEAKGRDDWNEWKKAIDSEYQSLVENNTWTLCDLLKGRKAITSKWVFKIKNRFEEKKLLAEHKKLVRSGGVVLDDIELASFHK
ncbi:MAG: hypothetical protein EOP45_20000 [Sphingobacteriaceae bacterium]|nr:MAG: hypothetical protein EOP45_20000 [Sphingobacteriaceae bacterium]